MATGITLAEATKQRGDGTHSHPLRTPYYNQRGDFISVYFDDVDFAGEVVDDVLTIYRSIDAYELVGCKICNVSMLAENVANIFNIDDENIQIRLLLLSAAGTKPARHHYYDLSRLMGDISMPTSELATV